MTDKQRAEALEVSHNDSDYFRKELDVTDKLFNAREKLLEEIPLCPVHGKCIPHALEWIAAAKDAFKELDSAKNQEPVAWSYNSYVFNVSPYSLYPDAIPLYTKPFSTKELDELRGAVVMLREAVQYAIEEYDSNLVLEQALSATSAIVEGYNYGIGITATEEELKINGVLLTKGELR